MDSITLSKRWATILSRFSSNVGRRVSNLKPDLRRSKASLSSTSVTESDDADPSLPPPSPVIPTSEQALEDLIESAMSEYLSTHPHLEAIPKDVIDTLISTNYTRVKDQVYLDYMGGCLLPESLVQSHADFLKSHILGNTHSDSPR